MKATTMNPTAETNDPAANAWILTKPVLAAGELTGSLDLIGPRATKAETTTAVERVLYVAQGAVTAVVAATHYVLTVDQTLHVSAGRPLTLWNHGLAPAKIFTLALPAKRTEETVLMSPK